MTVTDNGVPEQSASQMVVINVLQAPVAPAPPAPAASDAGGGGCTLSTQGRFDPLFPLLLLLATMYLTLRYDPYKEKMILLHSRLNQYPKIK